MAVMNHILFAHTRLVPVIASILTWYKGHCDGVGGSSRVYTELSVSVTVTH